MTHVQKWQVAESRLSAADAGPERVRRRRINVGSNRRQQEMAEDNGTGGSFQKTMKDGGSMYYNHIFGGQVAVMCITRRPWKSAEEMGRHGKVMLHYRGRDKDS